MKPIAHIHTGFGEKFGVPRQSGLADTKGYIIFEDEYANPDVVRGLEEFSHIWLIWQFSQVADKGWSPTVRPPRLGGNKRKGVFATRSPFRPNPIGLSCVELERIEYTPQGPVLHVKGADMVDKTPIYDIKPYIPYADSKPEARGGFAMAEPEKLEVVFPGEGEEAGERGEAGKGEQEGTDRGFARVSTIDDELKEVLREILAQDPRPSYQDDPDRVYGMTYEGWGVKFKVRGNLLTVIKICR